MTTVGGGDLVVVAQRGAHTGRDRLLADVEVEEAGQFGGFGEPAGCLFEESDPHHAAVQVHLHLGREFHRCPVCLVGRVGVGGRVQRLRMVTPEIPGAPYTWV